MWTSRTKYPNLSLSEIHFNIAFECGKKRYFIPLKWSRSGWNWWSRSEAAFTSPQLLSMNLSCLGRPYAFSQPFEYSCKFKKKTQKTTSQTAWCALILEWALWVVDCSCAVEVILQSLIALLPETLKWMRWGNHLMLCWKTTEPACFKSTNNRWWWCSLILKVRRTDQTIILLFTVWSVFQCPHSVLQSV